LAFSAPSLKSALGRVQEHWFIEDLARLTSRGKPILSPTDERVVRLAVPREATEVEVNRWLDQARGEDHKFGFAFLITLDAPIN
jgi:hypothetical protein